ncbi:MAG TPA: hypothetical protein P5555_00820 [Candidatus Paceibacterota bacterium]|nr:hypothetical protein [Verrucomicrobiota bacterium]HRZ43715.1 hypothetical protein [Candidatus Paceibacterota bacterium]
MDNEQSEEKSDLPVVARNACERSGNQNREKTMKTRLVQFARKPLLARGLQSRTAAWIACAAVLACATIRLDAAVIDGFEGPVKYVTGGGGMDYLDANNINGQMVWSGQYPGPFEPTGRWWRNWDNVYWPDAFPTLNVSGHTVEFRMDLISASASDLLLGFGCGGDSGSYLVYFDQDEIGLLKGHGNGATVFFWTDTPITNQNVTVVLSLTGMPDGVRLITKAVEKATGRVLFERQFLDTAGSDAPAPVPPPKGMDFFVADPGAPFTSITYPYAGVWDMRATTPPPLEVVLDNLEYDIYDAPELGIASAVLLSWPVNTADELIVVRADSPESSAVWTPVLEPIFKRFGELCTTVPVTQSQQFFKLVPGIQIRDDFSDSSGPFAGRNPWVPHFWAPADAARISFTVSNGAFHLQSPAPGPVDGRVLLAPPYGSERKLSDFSGSVDILQFAVGSNVGIGILGRLTLWEPVPDCNGYMGQLYLNRISPWIYDHGVPLNFTFNPYAQYRLQFSALGTHVTVRLLNLVTGEILEQQVTDNHFTQGHVGLILPMKAQQPFDITLDNFIMTCVKP